MNEEFIKEISILILNSMSLPLLLFDDKLNIIFLNKAFETVCLIDRNSLIGKNIFSCHKNLRSTELGKVEILKLKDYKEDKSMLSKMELKINKRTFHAFLSPIRDKKSGFIGGLLIMMDVTTEKDLEKLKAQTFSTVAHDIKNPLIAMVGFASLLLRGKKGNVTQDQARFLGIIKKEGEKAIRLADNFLTSVKIDFNKVGYYYERIDPKKWIQEIIKKMEPTFEAKNLDIIFEAEKAIPEIMIDPLQMERAICCKIYKRRWKDLAQFK
ncbi:MAG: PAS domain S-box protein [Deltaproteobacteria bacterium]|nr:PAS domain S-box protein [Deltaproteobacteria bacterium]